MEGVPELQNIFLGVVLLKLQGPEDLPDLPVDIGHVVACHIFQHLLGDSGPALAAVTHGQLLYGEQGPPPLGIALGVVKWIFITLWTVLLVGVCTALIGLHFFKEYIDTVVTPNVAVRAVQLFHKFFSCNCRRFRVKYS